MPLSPITPPTRLRRALESTTPSIQAAFYEALVGATMCWCRNRECGAASAKPPEVPTLLNFFLQMPNLAKALNEILNPQGGKATIKGIFCHRRGAYGATVIPDIPPRGSN